MITELLQRKLLSFCLLLALVTSPLAAPLTYAALQDDPKYSHIIERNGESIILMPDGRILPLASGVLCTTEECLTPELPLVTSGRKLWVVPIIISVIVVAMCVIRCRDCVTVMPLPPTGILPPVLIPPTNTPLAPVPESATGLLVAAALLGFCALGRKYHA